jgi:hypothetical protein
VATVTEPMDIAWSSLMKYDPDRDANLQRIAERERQSTDNTDPNENYEGRRFSNESAEERTMCDLCRVNRAQVAYHSDKTNPRVGHEDLDVCRPCWNDMYFSQERSDQQKYTDAMAINEGKIDPPPVQSKDYPPTNPDVLEEIANRINTGEPMDIAMRLLKAKYLDENMNNVLYGEQDPVPQPVAEEPPHVHSIEGDNELKRLERQQATASFSPLAGMVSQINPHTNHDRITELKQQAEQNVVVDPRIGGLMSASKIFPISSMPPKYREDLTPDEQYEDYYSQSWLERPDRVKPQELNDEAREKFPLKFTGEPMDLAMRLLKAKSKGQESLTEWTKEKWEFVGDDKKEMKKPRHKRGRYAPKSVADSMSPSQKATENKTKRTAHKKGKQHAPRGKSVKQMYRSVEGKK